MVGGAYMENDPRPNKLRDFRYYLPGIVKFYESGSERLTQVIFILLLLVQCTSTYLLSNVNLDILAPGRENFYYIFRVYLGTAAITDVVASIYLLAYINQLRGKPYNLKHCLHIFTRKLVSILAASLIGGILVGLGVLLLIVPGIIIYLMIMFNICYIVDLHMGALESLTASREITKGRKKQLFTLMFLFKIIFHFPVLLLIMSIGSFVVSAFVSAFAGTIICLMQQRLIAHMYMDLEYSELKKEEKPDQD
jgi:hypothetical protein